MFVECLMKDACLKRLPEVVMAILTSLLHHIKELFDPFTYILQTCTLILLHGVNIVYT